MQWLDLSGRIALVTGGNQGIGRAVAQLLAAHGATVIVNYPDDQRAPSALDELGHGAFAVRADLTRLSEIRQMFDTIAARTPHVDILVNNAGIYQRAHVEEVTEALWDVTLDTNLRAAFFCAQQAAQAMPQRGGRIVNITSMAAVSGPPQGVHYASSKGALISMTKSLARALAPNRIAVNAIAPGVTDTAQPALDRESAIAEGRRIPWGRIAQPEDVARAVLYFSSDLCEYVTGQTLFVNGGLMSGCG
jgi:3-oxoacyl-[acyl-carrier protein] reductase